MSIATGTIGLAVQTRSAGQRCILRPSGYVDRSTVDVLLHRGSAALTDGVTDLTIDCAGLDFIDAAGLACLVELRALAAGREAHAQVTGASEMLVRMLEVTGLEVLLTES